MIFNSFSFILIFLPIVVTVHYLLKRLHRPLVSKCFLLLASFFFYGYHNKRALALLILSILINYGVSLLMIRNETRPGLKKLLLFFGVSGNLGVLIYCKYLGFFSELAASLFHSDFVMSSLILPLGISYYTFSQIAYLADCHKDSSAFCSLLDYMLFVSFFPKVTIGPIAFSSEMIPWFDRSVTEETDYDRIGAGLMAFAFGLAKKMMMADTLARYVDWGYLNIDMLGTTHAFLIMIAFTMQIYFDFSGCCDMARGVCLMLGMDLPRNFDSPYRALSINEFWKRWHITLTRFFRTYVYFPLGGNRKGKIRTYVNYFIVFLLSGLWHGASLNFLLWGMMHGIGIIISKLISPVSSKWPKALRFVLTFMFVNLAWVYFRADDIPTAHRFFGQLFTGGIVPVEALFVVASTPPEFKTLQWLISAFTPLDIYYTGSIIVIGVLAFSVFASICMKNTDERIESFTPSRRLAIVSALLLVLGILSLTAFSKFIYVNF